MNPLEWIPLAALTLGLLGSGHCLAMCGGVACSLCAAVPAGAREKPTRQLAYSLAYNLGRVVSYAGAGLVAGSAGALAGGVVPVDDAQFVLRAVAGAITVGVGLSLAGVWPSFAKIERWGAPVWRKIEPLVGALLPARTPLHAVVLGLLWGWLPCGTLYSALTMALASGSALRGAATMVAFGLGTLPALLVFGALAGGVAKTLQRRRWVRASAGLAMAALGALNLLSVVGHAGWMPTGAPGVVQHCGGPHPPG